MPRREPAAGVVRGGADTVSTGLHQRLAERDAAARRLRLRKGLVSAAVLAVLLGLGWLLLASPVLELRAGEVVVEGTGTTVDPAEVRTAVEPELGTPLLRLDLSSVRERIEGIPSVRSVLLTRDWPHGLTVSIDAREPVAAAGADKGFVLLDPEGVQVGTSRKVPTGMPEVTVPLEDAERTGPALAAVLGVLAALPPELHGQVDEAGARSGHDVTLVLDDGATVRWGTAEENELKAAVLAVLREAPAEVYDVSTPRAPTTRQ